MLFAFENSTHRGEFSACILGLHSLMRSIQNLNASKTVEVAQEIEAKYSKTGGTSRMFFLGVKWFKEVFLDWGRSNYQSNVTVDLNTVTVGIMDRKVF